MISRPTASLVTEHLTTNIRAAQKGDDAAFRRLVEDQYAYAYRIAYRVLLNGDDARDAAQEAFIKLWKNIGAFRVGMNFTTWFYRIVANTALDRVRARTRQDELHRSVEPEQISRRTPLQDAEDSDVRSLILSLVQHLPPVQRLVFALRDVEDLTIEDVAGITGLSTASVKTNLSYARRTIRTHLGTHYGIHGSTQ